jgi:hypothetical protein
VEWESTERDDRKAVGRVERRVGGVEGRRGNMRRKGGAEKEEDSFDFLCVLCTRLVVITICTQYTSCCYYLMHTLYA